MLDLDGQPINRFYNRKRLSDRMVDELIGICKGVLADGVVTQSEAEFLQVWMSANIRFREDLIIKQLYSRIKEMLEDGILDLDEQQELFAMLCTFTGENSPTETYVNLTSALPLNTPAPNIIFPGMNFCFTGKFAYGSRPLCQAAVLEMGGTIVKGITKKLDYLVVGFFGSDTWAHTPYGRKIEKAVEYREKHGRLAIISEDHWASHTFA